MKTRIISLLTLTVIAVTIFFFLSPSEKKVFTPNKIQNEDEKEYQRARFQEERLKYEFDLLKDPKTGKIPLGIFEQERALARTLPVKGFDNVSARTTVLNNYIPAGPNNIGARTRALAYDLRYNGTTNRVIIAGSVSGGIMRSADGGATWTRASPVDDIHNVTTVAQDPRVAFQDTW